MGAKLLIVTTTRSPPSARAAEWTSSQDSARLIRDVMPGRPHRRDDADRTGHMRRGRLVGRRGGYPSLAWSMCRAGSVGRGAAAMRSSGCRSGRRRTNAARPAARPCRTWRGGASGDYRQRGRRPCPAPRGVGHGLGGAAAVVRAGAAFPAFGTPARRADDAQGRAGPAGGGEVWGLVRGSTQPRRCSPPSVSAVAPRLPSGAAQPGGPIAQGRERPSNGEWPERQLRPHR